MCIKKCSSFQDPLSWSGCGSVEMIRIQPDPDPYTTKNNLEKLKQMKIVTQGKF